MHFLLPLLLGMSKKCLKVLSDYWGMSAGGDTPISGAFLINLKYLIPQGKPNSAEFPFLISFLIINFGHQFCRVHNDL